jgi:hypothetical protein
MICDPCRTAADTQTSHSFCPGATWCECQHQSPPVEHQHQPAISAATRSGVLQSTLIVTTMCQLCGGVWDGELSTCPDGCSD